MQSIILQQNKFNFEAYTFKRICYVQQWSGIDENGNYFIINNKTKSHSNKSVDEIEMKEYQEIIVIVPISASEAKVYFISKFNFGSKLPNFVCNKIAIDRLKYLACIKCYFHDQNQTKIYETFRKATEIVNEMYRTSEKDFEPVSLINFEESFQEENFKIVEAIEEDKSEWQDIPDEDSAEAGAEINESSEIQSINDSYFDSPNKFKKSTPFSGQAPKRNTISVRPSYKMKTLISKNSEAPKPKQDVEVIYEEFEDES